MTTPAAPQVVAYEGKGERALKRSSVCDGMLAPAFTPLGLRPVVRGWRWEKACDGVHCSSWRSCATAVGLLSAGHCLCTFYARCVPSLRRGFASLPPALSHLASACGLALGFLDLPAPQPCRAFAHLGHWRFACTPSVFRRSPALQYAKLSAVVDVLPAPVNRQEASSTGPASTRPPRGAGVPWRRFPHSRISPTSSLLTFPSYM